MGNALKPIIYHNTLISIISPADSIENLLMLDIKAVIIRANHVYEDSHLAKYNCMSKDRLVKVDIILLAEKCKGLNEDIHVASFSEFRIDFRDMLV